MACAVIARAPLLFGGEHLTDGAAQGEVDPGGAAGGQGQAFGIGKSRGGGQNQSAGQNKAENFFIWGYSLNRVDPSDRRAASNATAVSHGWKNDGNYVCIHQ